MTITTIPMSNMSVNASTSASINQIISNVAQPRKQKYRVRRSSTKTSNAEKDFN